MLPLASMSPVRLARAGEGRDLTMPKATRDDGPDEIVDLARANPRR